MENAEAVDIKKLKADSAHWMIVEDIEQYLDAWPQDQRYDRVQWLLNAIGVWRDALYNEMVDARRD